MSDYLLFALLICVCLTPLFMVIWGLIHLHTQKGFMVYMVGTVISSFGVSAIFIENKGFSVIVGIGLSYLCYTLFCWLRDRKSKSYLDFAQVFLSTIEDPSYPSCKERILTDIRKMIESTLSKKLPKDIHRSIKLAIFDASFFYLGSSDYRDVFGELDDEGMQMLHICYAMNDHLRNLRIITVKTHSDNIEAIKKQSEPFYQ